MADILVIFFSRFSNNSLNKTGILQKLKRLVVQFDLVKPVNPNNIFAHCVN